MFNIGPNRFRFTLPHSLYLLQFRHCLPFSLCGIIFQKFLSVLNISFSEDQVSSFSCNSYNINKIHKLPFDKSSITSFSPLDLTFFDVWSSPVSSTDGYKYYVIFVDHYNKYI